MPESVSETPTKRKLVAEPSADRLSSGNGELTDHTELISDRDVHKTCYLIKPKKVKRNHPFISLDQSIPETDSHIAHRWKLYTETIATVQANIERILNDLDQSTLQRVWKYVTSTQDYDDVAYPQLPVGLVLAGANISNHARLFTNMSKYIEERECQKVATVVVTLRDASNLRDVLRKIIDQLVGHRKSDDDDGITAPINTAAQSDQTDKRLSYDLDLLVVWLLKHESVQKIVVIVQDADGSEGNLLPEVIRMLFLYRNRLPFVLLLGIATTLPIFNTKIPKRTMRMIDFEVLDVLRTDDGLTRLLDEIVLSSSTQLLLGPSLFRSLLKRYNNHTKNLETFTLAFQHANMAHFFANPLSTMLAPPPTIAQSKNHIVALRTLPSFKSYIDDMMSKEDCDIEQIRKLLTDPTSLVSFVGSCQKQFYEFISRQSTALKLLDVLQDASSIYRSTTVKRTRAEFYADAITGKLKDSPLVREIILFITKMSASTIDNLARLIDQQFDKGSVIRMMKDSWNIGATSGKGSHSKLISNISKSIRDFLDANLNPYTDIVFHELFVFDAVSLCENVFAPKFRSTIEKALMQPSYYLGQPSETPGFERPFISVAHTLYRESGLLINIYDYWTAFHQTLAGNNDTETTDNGSSIAPNEGLNDSDLIASTASQSTFSESQTLALFYKAMSELKYLGFLKETSGKRGGNKATVAVLQKMVWDGL
ncbi:origin recognition complex subunit 3 N-terminus-domain-containing protein [Lipomyces tetrasporus]|uniref:Origin recognition complex subunit 3 N-terminus-domain-containing protein n=1 Tax=Lipomyces tetrasporus TaxID=54092 RepID=A0AAD7QME0_9ASCO|nr:origin recognition complex subunit 3 N-terminus-domain-containing protein [Lipomyces tetrasporus]KAJ8098000.1 origin recognition complex subunit 3 N-terminus-domain-containing protein [Lipomyces tetrasporus]